MNTTGAGSRLARRLLASQLPECLDPTTGVSLVIHPDDEMLSFLVAAHDGDRDQGLAAYVSSALRIDRTLGPIVETWLREHGGDPHVLDFASGYGRVSRFLARRVPAGRLWVSDILAPAVEFQREALGFEGFVSHTEPNALVCTERFDVILVTSLFTHLPRTTFTTWLARLLALLTPGGLLVLTTHDVSLLGEHGQGQDFLFQAVSEIEALDLQDYGSTWVSERFMAEALTALGVGAWRRIPRGLLNHQDVYLIARRPADLAALPFSGELEGYVEHFALRGAGHLFVHGWACDPRWNDPLAEVTVQINETPAARCDRFGERRDVAHAHGIASNATFGWELLCPLPEELPRSEIDVLVKLRARSGRERVIYLANLEAALLYSAELEIAGLETRLELTQLELGGLKHHAAELERKIHMMETSRFWKLRERWFALKRALGRPA